MQHVFNFFERGWNEKQRASSPPKEAENITEVSVSQKGLFSQIYCKITRWNTVQLRK